MSELTKIIKELSSKYHINCNEVFELYLLAEKKYYKKHQKFLDYDKFYYKEVLPIIDRYLRMKKVNKK